MVFTKKGTTEHMITTTYSRNFITRKQVSLDIQESRCILVDALKIFGFTVDKTEQEFPTLLSAEEQYENLCQTYERLGYGRSD